MHRHFDEELKDLNELLLRMGAMAEEAIIRSVEALKALDALAAKAVIDKDAGVDKLELEIDEKCIDLIARHQPMAGDLRFLTTAMKLNAELERIADLSVDIAQRTLALADKPPLKPLEFIPRMGEIAGRMVRDAINSFINHDAELARKVVLADNEADILKHQVYKVLVEDYIMKDGSSADRAVPLLLVSRHLERICDHAASMAEDIIYMINAKVVRHHPEEL